MKNLIIVLTVVLGLSSCVKECPVPVIPQETNFSEFIIGDWNTDSTYIRAGVQDWNIDHSSDGYEWNITPSLILNREYELVNKTDIVVEKENFTDIFKITEHDTTNNSMTLYLVSEIGHHYKYYLTKK